MKLAIIIVGMGPGLSLGVAKRFGAEGYKIGMISRNADKLQGFVETLAADNIEAVYAVADVGDTGQLLSALHELQKELGRVDVLHYNAVDYRTKHILEENIDDLTQGFKISVGNALEAVKFLRPKLQESSGSVLFTGGGSADRPSPEMGSISLGKAGIRNLAYQLNEALQPDDIFVGLVTVNGWIRWESETHSPTLIAEKFWELYRFQEGAEVQH